MSQLMEEYILPAQETEVADLARQVNQIYEEPFYRSLGSTGMDYLPVAANTNTGGHQGGNSEFENPAKDRYSGDKGGNTGGNTSGSGGKGNK
jgi:hypothetical protein